MNKRFSRVVAAASAAFVVYIGVGAIEAVFLRFVGPPDAEIRSLSHLVPAIAFGIALYLWLDLRATRATLTGLERSQLVIDTQLALAGEIQRRLLPRVPTGPNHVRWAGRLEPAGKIGGDFYDFLPAGHASTLVVVGDVSGKGIPAALLQASAHSLFRTLSRHTTEPARLLEQVSREIYAENGGALYLTCLVVRIDGADGTLVYANAGHPPGLLLGRTGRRLLARAGLPAGMFPDAVYQSEVLQVEPGDLGVLMTDGITEAIEDDEVPAVDRLNATICGVSSPRTPERVCDTLMGLAERGSGPAGVPNWQDDKTVLAFVVEGEPDEGELEKAQQESHVWRAA
jgi:sigma-B regulation protein RsbU (phosphoserine phosphatase)